MNIEVHFDCDEQSLPAGQMVDAIRDRFRRIGQILQNQVQQSLIPIIRNAIESSETYRSILSGELRQEFGLLTPQSDMDRFVAWIIDRMSCRIIAGSGNMVGHIQVVILGSETPPSMSYSSGGGEVRWMEWLLSAGRKIVVADHAILLGNRPFTGSRAGYAIMLRRQVGPSAYQVPAEFAGTEADNWLTRAMVPVADRVDDLIQPIIERLIN